MIEGSGSGSVPHTPGSGSGRLKSLRIRNTASKTTEDGTCERIRWTLIWIGLYVYLFSMPLTNIADWDPYVFGHPGSGSAGQRYRPGSVSFCHQAKTVRKTLIPTVF